MARKTSLWAPLTAALVASLAHGYAIAGPFEGDTAVNDAGDFQAVYGLWRPTPDERDADTKFDPGYLDADGHRWDDAQAVKGYLLPAGPDRRVSDDAIKVRAARTADAKTIEVEVALVLPIDRGVIWEVLNDYENMPRFVPDVLATRLISAGPGRKRVEIEGVARFVFLEFPTHTTLDVVYPPDGSIALDSVAGNLSIHGVVQVHRDGPATRVDYRVRIAPDFWLPPLIGDYLIGRQIRRQFEGMVAEMHRRAGSIPMDGLTPGD